MRLAVQAGSAALLTRVTQGGTLHALKDVLPGRRIVGHRVSTLHKICGYQYLT